ncbi:protein RCC2 isoform X1 [Rhinatrema bivittatum]|uniref:protein RCC2 isoform X1 n=1 Tax=Rhinatrema bivittatum TaxID=194408 RepID=UPI00112C641A|nr:protein RCC2 isoform X1 [Rhinatrema bivittatum]XP_029434440.1 protein RCC2 isoform X1 [Rhinatrema bivittatum]XP_029434441.1 protein RCC2 isoform X1 [Rhinatrema bivittatum]XP_029434442.1 protein RCC2 isoform X1 [Rhinatrema bivittatum]
MPRKKVCAGLWEEGSGNGAARPKGRKKAGARGRKRGRGDRSSDEDDRDGSPGPDGGLLASGNKRGGAAKSPGKAQALVIITEPEHTKEKIKLEGSKFSGQLLIFGATNWDLIGRKEVPKQQAAYRHLGQNLWGPHRYGCLSGIQVQTVVSGPCAAHSLLITADGKLWSWGRNEKGQLGHGDAKRVDAPKPIESLSSEVFVSAACGRNHTLVLTEGPSLKIKHAASPHVWNQDLAQSLSASTNPPPVKREILYNGQPITKVSCGAEFSMIMDCKGNLYSFGCPEYGQLGHNSDGKFIARSQRIEYDCELIARRIAIFIEKTKDGQILPVPNVVVRDVACGINHTLVLDSQKRVFSWGFGGYGRLGHTEQKDEMVPRLVKLFDFPGRGAVQIYTGSTCSFAVSETGGLFFWGATNTSRDSTMYPKAVQDLCGWKIRSLACGKSSVIVAADDSTISWGPSPTFGELGYGDHKPKSSTTAQEVKTLDGLYIEQVAMGYAHSLVIVRDESEQEREKLKKLPEYNPRTL